jgi:hypothetical protein
MGATLYLCECCEGYGILALVLNQSGKQFDCCRELLLLLRREL